VRWANTNADAYHQVDTACDGSETGSGHWVCIHGGEKRKVDVPSIVSCAGLGLEDSRDWFRWVCDDRDGHAVFYTAGLRDEVGLSALVADSGWLNASVTLSNAGGALATSAPTVWWGNDVIPLPDNSTTQAVALDQPGAVYLLSATRETYGYNVNADRVALVVAEGASLEGVVGLPANCNGATTGGDGELDLGALDSCVVAAGSQTFLWFEGTIGAQGPAAVAAGAGIDGGVPVADPLYIARSRFVRVRRANVVEAGFYTGLLLEDVADSWVDQVHAAGSRNHGVRGRSNDRVVYSRVVTSSNRDTGLYLSSSSDRDSTVTRALLTSSEAHNLELATSTGTTVAFATVVASGSHGVYLNSATTPTLSQIVAIGNDNDGLLNNGASGAHITTLVTTNSGDYGARSTSMSSAEVHGDWLVGNNLIADCATAGAGAHGFSGPTCAIDDGSTATITAAVDGSGAFVGRLATNDTVNATPQFQGAAPYADVSDWLAFETPWRMWANDGPAPFATHGCGRDPNCRIWDWALSGGGAPLRDYNGALVDGAACPAAVDGDVVVTDQQSTPNTYLLNAAELLNDSIGDEDGLCESGEHCVYQPHLGAWLGDGDPRAKDCVFADGTVSGVLMYGY
jgi:hypothetical protein